MENNLMSVKDSNMHAYKSRVLQTRIHSDLNVMETVLKHFVIRCPLLSCLLASPKRLPLLPYVNLRLFLARFSSFLGTVLCASKVPTAFAELRKSLRDLYQNSLTEGYSELGNQKRSMMLLQSVIGEEEFYFTAWGFINLNKSLILSALGALVTYGILLVQYKLPSESV
ncbi:hypothetical protein CDAR_208881 [Caerostris darwini]|uniref:Uncharacterized protein n=1 Tax=Caerostris darwini TaxID=1538125 RepID=A0AAV4WSP0_9ARAC|nr:hypothetical protein CDAR_208881 [Caerostris darwini]